MKQQCYEFIHRPNDKDGSGSIGFGSCGEVKIARNTQTNAIVAIKQMPTSSTAKHQISLHRKLNHPNIIKLLNYYQKNTTTYMVLEFAQNGSLNEKIKHNFGMMSKTLVKKYFKDVCEGVKYLHAKSYMHRDIKPENVLITAGRNKEGGENGEAAKLCDFGLLTEISNSTESTSNICPSPDSKHPSPSKPSPRFTVCGTFQYMAPEMIKKRSYNHKIDIWALGILLFEMIQGVAPFRGQTGEQVIREMKKPIKFSSSRFNALEIDLIKKILRVNAENRPQVREILKHQYFLQEGGEDSSRLFKESNTTLTGGYSNLYPNNRRPINTTTPTSQQPLKTSTSQIVSPFFYDHQQQKQYHEQQQNCQQQQPYPQLSSPLSLLTVAPDGDSSDKLRLKSNSISTPETSSLIKTGEEGTSKPSQQQQQHHANKYKDTEKNVVQTNNSYLMKKMTSKCPNNYHPYSTATNNNHYHQYLQKQQQQQQPKLREYIKTQPSILLKQQQQQQRTNSRKASGNDNNDNNHHHHHHRIQPPYRYRLNNNNNINLKTQQNSGGKNTHGMQSSWSTVDNYYQKSGAQQKQQQQHKKIKQSPTPVIFSPNSNHNHHHYQKPKPEKTNSSTFINRQKDNINPLPSAQANVKIRKDSANTTIMVPAYLTGDNDTGKNDRGKQKVRQKGKQKFSFVKNLSTNPFYSPFWTSSTARKEQQKYNKGSNGLKSFNKGFLNKGVNAMNGMNGVNGQKEQSSFSSTTIEATLQRNNFAPYMINKKQSQPQHKEQQHKEPQKQHKQAQSRSQPYPLDLLGNDLGLQQSSSAMTDSKHSNKGKRADRSKSPYQQNGQVNQEHHQKQHHLQHHLQHHYLQPKHHKRSSPKKKVSITASKRKQQEQRDCLGFDGPNSNVIAKAHSSNSNNEHRIGGNGSKCMQLLNTISNNANDGIRTVDDNRTAGGNRTAADDMSSISSASYNCFTQNIPNKRLMKTSCLAFNQQHQQSSQSSLQPLSYYNQSQQPHQQQLHHQQSHYQQPNHQQAHYQQPQAYSYVKTTNPVNNSKMNSNNSFTVSSCYQQAQQPQTQYYPQPGPPPSQFAYKINFRKQSLQEQISPMEYSGSDSPMFGDDRFRNDGWSQNDGKKKH